MKNRGVKFFTICILFFTMACDKDRIQYHLPQIWSAPMEYDDSGAKKSLNVAVVSFDVDLSKDVNLHKVVVFIDKIKAEQPDIRLILFPEITLGYYYEKSNPSEYQKSIAETIPGETTNILVQKAIEHEIYISLGMAEKSGEEIYNSQVLISPDGEIKSVYRKYYLTEQDKKSGFKAGSDFVVDVIDNIKVVTIICNDMNSMTVNKKIHELGAELILLPMANGENPYSAFLPFYQSVYAWVLMGNRIGKENNIKYDGLLFISSPGGTPIEKSTEKEGYIYGVVKCW